MPVNSSYEPFYISVGKSLYDNTVRSLDIINDSPQLARVVVKTQIVEAVGGLILRTAQLFSNNVPLIPLTLDLSLVACSLLCITRGIPTLTFEESELFSKLQVCIEASLDCSETLEEVLKYSLGNKGLYRRLINRHLLQNKIYDLKVYEYVTKLYFRTPHINPENLSSTIDKVESVEWFLANQSNQSIDSSHITEDLLLNIVHYSKIEILNEDKAEGLNLLLKQLKAVSIRIIENGEIGLQNLPSGSISLVKIQIGNSISWFLDSFEQLMYGHASLLHEDQEIHITHLNLVTNKVESGDPNRYEYLELDFEDLLTPQGRKILNQFVSSNLQDYLRNKFKRIIYESILEKELDDLFQRTNTPLRRGIQLLSTYFFKQKASEVSRQPLNTSRAETCSSFVAKFIEGAITKLNQEIQKDYWKYLEKTNPQRLTHISDRIEASCLCFVNSPFPPLWDLDKLTPSDLATKFPAFKRSKSFWGKFAPYL